MRLLSNKCWRNHVGRSLTLTRGRPRPFLLRRELVWLERWAAALNSAELHTGDDYWNFKIPISSGLAMEAARRPRVERRVLKALLNGARALRANPALSSFPEAKVAALVITEPDYFSSEVTVFFDPEYYQRFLYTEDQTGRSENPLSRYGLALPDGFSAWGTRFSYPDDWSGTIMTEEHWTFGEPV